VDWKVGVNIGSGLESVGINCRRERESEGTSYQTKTVKLKKVLPLDPVSYAPVVVIGVARGAMEADDTFMWATHLGLLYKPVYKLY